MELVLFISLALGSNYPTANALREANAHGSHPDSSSWLGTTQSSKKKQSGKKRSVKKSQKAMPAPNAPADNNLQPVLDTPNRMEIDPGDIPPTQRRNPDVDDRTKIPENIDPGDRVPPSAIPKQKKPNPTPKELG